MRCGDDVPASAFVVYWLKYMAGVGQVPKKITLMPESVIALQTCSLIAGECVRPSMATAIWAISGLRCTK